MPSARMLFISVRIASEVAKLPDYLVRRRRVARRLSTLSLTAGHITPSAKDQPPSLSITSAAPRPGLLVGEASPWLGAEELGVRGSCSLARSRQAGGPRCAPLLPAGSQSPSVCPCVTILCKRV